MEMVTSIIVGVASSILSSLIFLYFFLAKKTPRIDISEYICKETDGGVNTYWFKYVNRTDVPIYDVKVDAYFLTPVGTDGGHNLKIEDINLKHSTYTHVPNQTQHDHNAMHAVQVRCDHDLEKDWIDKASLIRFEVIAKHELSGFSKVHVKDYHNKNKIKVGTFKFGNDLDAS